MNCRHGDFQSPALPTELPRPLALADVTARVLLCVLAPFGKFFLREGEVFVHRYVSQLIYQGKLPEQWRLGRRGRRHPVPADLTFRGDLEMLPETFWGNRNAFSSLSAAAVT